MSDLAKRRPLFNPGSTTWLLFHELRLSWRGILARRGGGLRGVVIAAVALVAVAAFAGVPLGLRLRHFVVPISRVSIIISDLALLAAASLMLSQTLASATEALYQRGDLELLFSSPTPPGRILAARFIALAVTVFLTFAVLVSPVLIPVALIGHPTWLSFYLVLAATALLSAALGLALSVGLFHLIGARRTRAAAQILAAVIGAGFFLGSQASNFLGHQRAGGLWAQALRLADDPNVVLPPFADAPIRAMLGAPLPLGVMLVTAVVAFFGITSRLGRRFAADAARAGGADTHIARVSDRAPQFRAGAFGAILRKEVRLLWRDAALISQVMLRTLYLIPLGFLVIRNAGSPQGFALAAGAGGLAFIAGQVAGTLAWITISAEEAPDLLAGAPVSPGLFRQAKLTAAYLPLIAFLAPFLVTLILLAPIAGAAATGGCVAASIACGLINIWYQKPSKRSDFRRRRGSSWFATLAEAGTAGLIALATGIFAAGSVWGIAPVLPAVGLMLVLRRSDAQIAKAMED